MQLTAKIKYSLSDTQVMIRRCLLHSLRNFDTLITTIVLPIMMMLLFVYVLGGAINTGSGDYIHYVVPGIILLCIGYCASTTAVSVYNDISKGIIARFRSMPIAKSSVLTGHVLASVIRNMLSTSLVMLVAFIMGFQAQASASEWMLVVIILLLYTLTMTWISVVFGLLANSAEGAGAFSFFVLFLPYLSSAFVPTSSMPTALRVFAENQPITPIIETIRSLLMDAQFGDYAGAALLWCVGALAVSYSAALLVYRHKSI